MPLDVTVKFGPEVRGFLSSSGQALLSINLQEVAVENIGGTIVWEEIGYIRFPISRQEPITQFEVRKGFLIDHTKRGPDQNKTGSFVSAWQNTDTMVRRYKNVQCMLKLQWHVEGISAVDEYEYLKGVRFTNITREIPEQEVVERAEFIWSTWGHRVGP